MPGSTFPALAFLTGFTLSHRLLALLGLSGFLIGLFRYLFLRFRIKLKRLTSANSRLQAEIHRRENAETLQQVLFGIASAVHATHDLSDLYPAIQAQLSKIIDTDNFFITLVDPLTRNLEVGFMRDQHQVLSTYPQTAKTLSHYVISTGKPLLVTATEIEKMIKAGDIELHGAPAKVWLGVPLRIRAHVLGLVCVQHYEDPNRYTRKEMALLQFVSEQVALAIQRKQDQEALLRSEKEKTLVLSHLSEQVVHYDSDLRIIWINQAAESEMGQGKPLIGEVCYRVWHGRETPCPGCAVVETLKTGKPITREDTSQSGIVGLVKTYPVQNETGQTTSVVEIMMDITDRIQTEQRLKQSLKEKEILLKEIHHRVKNNMQIISSLLNLQASHQPQAPLEEAFRESQARIRSMALVHEQLYQSADLRQIAMADYITQLATHLARIFTLDMRHPIRFDIQAHGVALPINLAIPCGLVINELISNAMKYAFPDDSNPSAAIRVTMETLASDRIRLRISDNGIGLPDHRSNAKSQSLGLKLVQILVSDQLQGTLTLENGQGSTFLIEFPNHA